MKDNVLNQIIKIIQEANLNPDRFLFNHKKELYKDDLGYSLYIDDNNILRLVINENYELRSFSVLTNEKTDDLKHELYRYAKIKEKNGNLKISFTSSHSECNIYKKLVELGYKREAKNKFYTIFEKYDDNRRVLNICDIRLAFEEYLKTIDLSYFDGKITKDDVIEAFHRDSPIKQGRLIISVMKT
ncbi:hypothetical protein FACS1894145_5720 [Bacteroidia bacterium]|nr:hypothetical protein FACS1894145_5720 [Bacteroidia bacterium]